ncbi:MAG: precorrin-8X methylmutase [Syntrophobacteraceae bacterium]
MILKFPERNRGNRPGLVKAGRDIEEESFRIIDHEIGEHEFAPDEWQIIRRVIHSTGDFEYAQRIQISPDAVEAGIEAFKRGVCIYADTRMIRAGLSPWRLEWFGNGVVTPADDVESQKAAVEMGTTRTLAAFRRCSGDLNGSIVVIGNAPTALQEVVRLIEQDGVRPSLVIGVPVGFVQAEESKESLWQLPAQPAITVMGRKGGSTVAVAMVHALLELAKRKNG